MFEILEHLPYILCFDPHIIVFKYKFVSRESCTAVQDLLCYVQWPVVLQMRMRSEVKLPTCDQSLPSKWNKSETCTEAGLFDREDSKVRSEFHDCIVEAPSELRIFKNLKIENFS